MRDPTSLLLTERSDAQRRMVLACYAEATYPEGHAIRTQVFRQLWANHLWAPTPDDCPVPWDELQAAFAAGNARHTLRLTKGEHARIAKK